MRTRTLKCRKPLFAVVTVLAVLAFASAAAAQSGQTPAKGAQALAKGVKTEGSDIQKGPAKIEMPKPDEKAFNKDDLADQKRDEAIKMLREIYARFQPGPRKADVMFQLAELYWEKSKYLYFKEMHDYEQAVEECHKKSKDARKCDEIKISTRESEIYRKQALDIYQKIVKEYPDYPRKDEVLFVLGYNLYEMGKKNDGIRYYWDLIKQFPASKWAPDAYLALGEHFFNNNEVFKAVQAYQKALGYKDAKIYVFALYKLAWCDYNLGEYDKGIEKLKQVVEIAETEQSKGQERSRIQLKREAINDLSLFFSQVDAVDEAKDYFEKTAGRNVMQEQMKRLARIYEEQGKNDQEIKTYRLVINEFPNDPNCPSYQSDVVQAYKRMGNKQAVQKEIRRLVDLYRPNSPWAKQNADDKKAIAQAYDLTETALRDIVQEYHQEAQKTKDVRTYQLARDIYKEYLDNFPNADHAYRLRFFYAEILYTLEDFEKAAEQYAEVVNKNPKGEFSEKAAYNAVLALERTVELEKKGQSHKALEAGKIQEKKDKGSVKRDVKLSDMKLVAGKAYEKKEIPRLEKLLAEACDRFTQIYPKNQEFFAVKFKAAHIYYKYNHFDEASKRFGEFIDRYPENKYAQYAADLILDSYNIKEDWKNVHYWAKRFYDSKTLAGQKDENNKNQLFGAHLQEVIEGAQFKIAMEIMDKDKKKEEAAVAFRAFMKDFPESKYGLKALYNAMVLFADEHKLDLAIETGNMLLDKYAKETPGPAKPQKLQKAAPPPKKDAAKKDADKQADADKTPKSEEVDPIERARYLVGIYYDQTADFKTAADFFEKYYEKYPKTKDAPDAIYNAALFREALGDFNKAIENYGKYVKDFPDRKDAADIVFKTGKIYQRREDYTKAKAIFQGFLDKYGKQLTPARQIEAEFELAACLRQMGQSSAADKELEKLLKISQGLTKEDASEKVFYMIANARFQMAEPLFREYEAIKLELPESRMKQNLKLKGEKLTKLVEIYTDILKMGQGDMGIAALCRIGLMYQNFAKALFEAPMPKYLNEEQKEIYQAELQNQAFPVEEKAIEAFEKSTSKSYELGVYNEWATLAQNNLNKYKPGTYPDLPQTKYVAKEYFYLTPFQKAPGQIVKQPEPPPPAPAPIPAPAPAPASQQPAKGGQAEKPAQQAPAKDATTETAKPKK